MFSNKTIWILEDDPGCQFVFEEILSFRYHLKTLSTMEEYKKELEKNILPDLLIADLNLGNENFLNFLKDKNNSNIKIPPFIVVSSLDDIDALRYCYSKGALDYLVKPFKKNELVVKIENILNIGVKNKATTLGEHEYSDIILNKVPDLTMKELKILKMLFLQKETGVERDHIINNVWNEVIVNPKTLDVHLTNLRKKVSKFGIFIKTNKDGKITILTNGMNL